MRLRYCGRCISAMRIPASRQWWPGEPTPKQAAALALYGIKDALYGGAAGGGKSEYLLMAASQFADHPDSHALLLRKTYQDLVRPDALLDRARKWWEHLSDVKFSSVDKKFTFPSGATIEFGHLQNSGSVYQYQGGAYTMIGIDEASQIPQFQMAFLQTRLRKPRHSPVPLQYRLASNPGNVSHHYLKQRYVDTPNTTKRVFLPAKLQDNPHMDAEQYVEQFEALSPVERAQLLDGDWSVVPTTEFFDLEKIRWVDEVPEGKWRWIRSWDYAATKAKPGKDPDYTAGGLIGFLDGQFILADMERFREEPAQTEERVLRVAGVDGRQVAIYGEEEGGSSGKSVTMHMSRALAGYSYTGVRPTGDKKERARIVASAIRNKNFLCVSGGKWVYSFIEEMRGFPEEGLHDDQVDCVSQAVAALTDKKRPGVYRRRRDRKT